MAPIGDEGFYCFRPIQEGAIMTLHDIKMARKLTRNAQDIWAIAYKLPVGEGREALERRAADFEQAATMYRWLTSSDLRAPV